MSELAFIALGIDSSGMKTGEREAVRSLLHVEDEMKKAESLAATLGKELTRSTTQSSQAMKDLANSSRGALGALSGLGGPVGTAASKMESLGRSVIDVGKAFGVAGTVITLGVTAVTAAAAGFVALSISASKSADAMFDVSEATGLTVDQVQLLSAAMQRSGEDISGVERSFRSFQSAVVQAVKDPTSDAARNLKAMGISAKDAGRDIGGAFIAAIGSLKEIRSSADGAAASNEVLGRNIGALTRSSENAAEIFKKSNSELAAMGIVANKVALNDAAELDSALNRLSQSAETLKINLSGLGQGIIGTALKALARVLEEINGALDQLNNFKSGAKQGAGILGQAFQQGPFAALSRQRELSAATSGTGPVGGITPPKPGIVGGGSATPFAFPEATARQLDEQRRLNAEYEVGSIRASDLSESIQETSSQVAKLRKEMQILAGTNAFGAVVEQFLKANARLTELLKRPPALPVGTQEDRDRLLASLPLSQPPGVNEVGALSGGQTLGQGSKTTFFDDDQRAILTQQFDYIFEDFFRAIITGRATLKEAFGQLAEGILDTFATAMIQSLQKAFINPLVDGLTNLLTNALDGLFNGLAGGGLGKIFGGIGKLFGGFFADGGTLGAGKWGVAGERGPELIYSGSRPMQVMAGAMGGGGNVYVTNHFSISAPNGRVERRSLDQVSEASTSAISRAQRNRGA